MSLDTRPSDLQGLPLDDVAYLLVGNEVDTYFEANYAALVAGWTEFKTLLDEALSEVHASAPTLPAGVSYKFGTVQNALYETAISWQSSAAGFLAVTYYFGGNDSLLARPAPIRWRRQARLGAHARRFGRTRALAPRP